jgi:hypothetical protein
MRRLLYRALLAVGVVLAAAVAWVFLRPPDPVTVVFVNESDKPVAQVVLRHEKGSKFVRDIPAGQSRTVTFRTRGETSYTVSVQFADGKTLAGTGSYAEAGYSFTETISDTGVKNELTGMQY